MARLLLPVLSLFAVLNGARASLTRRVACPDGKNTATNAACCPIFAIRDDIQRRLFDNGQCNEEARESLRLTFHDAIAISPTLGGGGADGSIALFSEVETKYSPNIGLDEIVAEQRSVHEAHKHQISMADFIMLAGAIGTSNCPGAPRLDFHLGRKDATSPAPDGLVPEPFHDADTIFARMADASNGTFTPKLTVWLLASHTIASASHVDPSTPGAPLDSTPGTWDTQFFIETQLRGTTWTGQTNHLGEAETPLKGEMRLQSDHDIARDSRSACEWQSFVGNQAKAQNTFTTVFRELSMLGQDPNGLTDCSEVMPTPQGLPSSSHAHFPAGLNNQDIEQACAETPFPTLPTDPGPKTSVHAVQVSSQPNADSDLGLLGAILGALKP
ncbi:manganese peroxidase 1 precursor [Pilatotrama ljubarskyi]|nr:manganese peroxidase 1 precursor [Pilatotrama ljubarskyi]